MLNRFLSLRRRHAALDAAVETEQARPAPDTVTLTRMKKEKLAVKDELVLAARSRVRRKLRRSNLKFPLHGV
ncbi:MULTISPECIES: YdcH family protein [Hyphobacterium]|uniref:YdcH family protein n=1 Tax=Hyphobacterium vulgare TaxID=1736751 RepID=A0ABV7A0D5_9PROT